MGFGKKLRRAAKRVKKVAKKTPGGKFLSASAKAQRKLKAAVASEPLAAGAVIGAAGAFGGPLAAQATSLGLYGVGSGGAVDYANVPEGGFPVAPAAGGGFPVAPAAGGGREAPESPSGFLSTTGGKIAAAAAVVVAAKMVRAF